MLVLSRKRFQSIQIGDDIKVTIVKIDGNQVRIGIEAPQGVTILRSELLEPAVEESPVRRPLQSEVVEIG